MQSSSITHNRNHNHNHKRACTFTLQYVSLLLAALALSHARSEYVAINGALNVDKNVSGQKLFLVQHTQEGAQEVGATSAQNGGNTNNIVCENFVANSAQFGALRLEADAVVNEVVVETISASFMSESVSLLQSRTGSAQSASKSQQQPFLRTQGTITIAGEVHFTGSILSPEEYAHAGSDEDSAYGSDAQLDEFVFLAEQLQQGASKQKYAREQAAGASAAPPQVLHTRAFTVDGAKQWVLLEVENFDFSDDGLIYAPTGWQSSTQHTSASDKQQREHSGGGALTMSAASRVLEDLPSHEYIRIEANFYFYSRAWNGDAAYIKVDGQVAWMDTHDWDVEGGGDGDAQRLTCAQLKAEGDYAWGYPINVVVRHSARSAKIEVATSVKPHTQYVGRDAKGKDADEEAECWRTLHLVGLDDVNIYVK